MKKSFKTLLLSQSCANLADVLFKVTIISNIYLITHSILSTSIIPVIIGSTTLVSSFFLPVITRKLRLNHVLLYTQFAKAVALTCLFLWITVLKAHLIAVTFVLVTVISFMDGFAHPTSSALIPRFATNLTKANSIFAVANETIQIAGWGLGGLLFVFLGLHQMMMLTVLLFWLASVICFYLPQIEFKVVENETTVESILKGWKHIISNTQLKLIFSINVFEMIANSIWVSSIILVFIDTVLNENESYWGYTNMLHSVGIILGGWGILHFSDALNRHKSLWIVISLILTATTLSFAIIFIHPMIFLIASLCIGFFSQLKEIPETILIQESVEEDILVNVYSAIEVWGTLIFSISIFIMSGLAEWIPVIYIFWLATMLIATEAAIVFIARKQLNQ